MKHTRKSPLYRCPSGFSLVELAVVLFVIGLLMAGTASMVRPYIDSYRYASTQMKMERIADAISSYARINYDLPCPTNFESTLEPFGAPSGAGVDGERADQPCLGHKMSGVVPFLALGLEENQVKDSYGNYFTYTIFDALIPYKSTAFDANANHDQNVRHACRSQKWIDFFVDFDAIYGTGFSGNYGDALLRKNLNYRKARFCCPFFNNATEVQLQVYDSRANAAAQNRAGRLHISRSHIAHMQPNDDNAAREIIDDTTAWLSTTSEAIAFTLVSHGKNGDGAFRRDGSRRPVTTTVATTQETPNRGDSPKRFVMRPPSLTQDADYFDDIVIWRTNHQIISDGGFDSCSRP